MDKDAIMGNWWPWGETWMCNWCWWVKEMEIGMSERGCGMTCGGCRKSMISSTLFYYFFIYWNLRLNPIEEPVWNELREVGAMFLFVYLFYYYFLLWQFSILWGVSLDSFAYKRTFTHPLCTSLLYNLLLSTPFICNPFSLQSKLSCNFQYKFLESSPDFPWVF